MALEESTDNLERLESNRVNAYIDRELLLHLKHLGDINIDYATDLMGRSGYRIFLGEDQCASGECSC
jgi:hypothetical protein